MGGSIPPSPTAMYFFTAKGAPMKQTDNCQAQLDDLKAKIALMRASVLWSRKRELIFAQMAREGAPTADSTLWEVDGWNFHLKARDTHRTEAHYGRVMLFSIFRIEISEEEWAIGGDQPQ
jgi:hypothetical protein